MNALAARGPKYLHRRLEQLTKQSAALAEKRAALPPGSSRARVTSANAKWARVAEERERIAAALAELEIPVSEVVAIADRIVARVQRNRRACCGERLIPCPACHEDDKVLESWRVLCVRYGLGEGR